MIKKEIGGSFVLVGVLLLVLMLMFSNDASRVTGNFFANEKNSIQMTGNSALDNSSIKNSTNSQVNSQENPSDSGGTSILNNPTNKMIVYGIFILIIVIGVFLIALGGWKKKAKSKKSIRIPKRKI